MSTVLGMVSDVHAGSAVAVCPPVEIELDDGGTFQPSKVQREWLWPNWLANWKRVGEKRQKHDKLGILVDGDAVEGHHHGSLQVVSADPAVQMWILRKLFEPVLALKPDFAIVVRGTETHVGKSAGTEEDFARWLGKQGISVPKSDNGMYSHWHFEGEIEGKLISAAHHGRMGSRPWTKGGQVTNLAIQIMTERADEGNPIPDLAVRGHFHQHYDTHDACRVRLIQMPAWQLHTAHSHKVVPETLSDIGGVVVKFEKNKPLDVESVIFKPTRPKVVKL